MPARRPAVEVIIPEKENKRTSGGPALLTYIRTATIGSPLSWLEILRTLSPAPFEVMFADFAFVLQETIFNLYSVPCNQIYQ